MYIAICIMLYVFSFNSDSQLDICLELTSDKVEQRLRNFAPSSNKLNDDYLKVIISQIVTNLSTEEIKSFIFKCENISKSEYIFPYELLKIIYDLPLKDIKIEIDSLLILLLRKSKSLIKIKTSIVKIELIDIVKSMMKIKFRSKTLSISKASMKSHKIIDINQRDPFIRINIVPSDKANGNIEEQQSYQKPESLLKPKKENIDKSSEIKDFIIRLCEQIYKSKKTISEIVDGKVFDQVIDGKEYQLIKRKDLIQSLENQRITLTTQDLNLIKDVIRPIWIDSIDIKNLEEITKNFGINEDYPADNQHLNYSTLTGSAVRTFNKIIKYITENNISDIMNLIPKNKIEKITLVSKTKEETIDFISSSSLEEVLRSKNILKRSENLDQEIIDFTEINQNFDSMIMIRKLKKAINDTVVCKINVYLFFEISALKNALKLILLDLE